LAKEEMIEMEGTVEEVLPNTQFRVRLSNGANVLAYAGGKIRQRYIRIIAGDRVRLEISPYDATRGRINSSTRSASRRATIVRGCAIVRAAVIFKQRSAPSLPAAISGAEVAVQLHT
jgi:translation initiation factor IF-1